MKTILRLIEAFFVYFLYAIFRLIGLDAASFLSGKIARFIGTKLKVSQIARSNIKMAMGNLSDIERDKIVADMWENLGRTVGEMPHLKKILRDRVAGIDSFTQHNINNIADKKGRLVISGHFANWEVGAALCCVNNLVDLSIYRPANNKYVDYLIQYMRADLYSSMVPKGKMAAKEILKTLKKGQGVGMLVDQKMNNGISVPFFNRAAMTAPAVAELALKYNVPIIPVQITRQKGANFSVIIHQDIATDNRNNVQIMTNINQLLESWIIENPAQWFWVHKRWG